MIYEGTSRMYTDITVQRDLGDYRLTIRSIKNSFLHWFERNKCQIKKRNPPLLNLPQV